MPKLKQLSLLFAVFVRGNIKIKSLSHVKVLPDETALMRPFEVVGVVVIMVMMVIDNGELNGKWLFIGDRKC